MQGLPVKEPTIILDAIGMKRDDCFEKSDLIARIEEYKEQKASKKAQNKTSSNAPRGDSKSGARTSAAAGASTSAPQMPTGDFTYMPTKDLVCFKITSVGNSEVGKSCLIKRYCEGRFVKRYISTIGVDYGVKKLTVKN